MRVQSVTDVMTRDPVCCSPDDPITEVARSMVRCDCGAVPVVDTPNERRLVGMITDRDIVCRVIAEGMRPDETTVSQAMSRNIASLSPDASVDECIQLMSDRQVRRVPVVDEDRRVVGIVAQADLARASTGEPTLEEEVIDMLEEVSEPTGAPSSA
jgi:CBS domain-containing protein